MNYLTFKLTQLSKKNIREICAMLGMSYEVFFYKVKHKTLRLKDIENLVSLFPELTLDDLLLATRKVKKMDRSNLKRQRKNGVPGQYPHSTKIHPVKKKIPQSLVTHGQPKNWFKDV